MRKNSENRSVTNYDTAASPAYRGSLAYLLIGGGIGATLALLFAPKSGSQFRGDIAKVSRKGYEAAADKAKMINERSGELVNAVKDKAGSVYEFAKRQDATGTDKQAEASVDHAALSSESNKGVGRVSIG